MANSITIYRPPGAISLPDNDQWQNRFEIRSASSGRVYVVSQNKQSGKWGCSCPGYCIHRTCKHLKDGCHLTPNQIHGADQMEDKRAKKRRLA